MIENKKKDASTKIKLTTNAFSNRASISITSSPVCQHMFLKIVKGIVAIPVF